MEVHIHWNEYIEKWIVRDKNGFAMFDIPGCVNFDRRMEDLDKNLVCVYELERAKRIRSYSKEMLK